jgi:hypothetical protein
MDLACTCNRPRVYLEETTRRATVPLSPRPWHQLSCTDTASRSEPSCPRIAGPPDAADLLASAIRPTGHPLAPCGAALGAWPGMLVGPDD